MSRLTRLAFAGLACMTSLEARASWPEPPQRLSDVLPAGARVIARALEPADLGPRLDLYLQLPDVTGGLVSEAFLEELVRAALAEAGDEVSGVLPWVATPRDGWVPLPSLLPAVPPVPAKPGEGLVTAGPATGGRRPGALTGKVVYVSAGHGWTWTPSIGRWATQRGNTHGVVEDMVSIETINTYLVRYLENAGATVFTVRERDVQTAMVIVDDGGAQGGGRYSEAGGWSDSTGDGFEAGRAPYAGTTNPFALGGTRVVATGATATATASYVPNVPRDGLYQVYVSYAAGSNRAPDAHYVVRHAGGEAHVRVDQRRHGGTWFPIGQWYFRAGEDAARGAVVLQNDSAAGGGTVVSADAVRFGGGLGDAARGTSATSGPKALTSGKPRYEENSRYHVQFSGAPSSVYATSTANPPNEPSEDVSSRSRYAAWQNETGEDAVYVSWHTNAPNPARGTISFVYGPNPPNGDYDFEGTAGSDRLGRLIHDEIVRDIRGEFDPSWKDRGLKTAYFGEINPRHNAEMPAALVEVCFHDTEADAAWLKEPRFREVAARAYYQGIVKYFAERDGTPVVLAPDVPTHSQVTVTGPTTARVAWRAPVVSADIGGHAATGYRVYVSEDGRAFDDGTAVSGTSFELQGLEPGVPVFVRVSATNAGGESNPSPVLAAATGCGSAADGLLVHGFYRHDVGLAWTEDLSAYGLGTAIRMLPERMNRYDAVVGQAGSLAASGLSFDGAEAPTVEVGDAALGGYALLVWALGEESSADETFSEVEQERLGAWLGEGRTLVVSGSELGWDLGASGDAADQAFLASLGVDFAADDAGTYALETPDGGQLTLDDGTRGTYDVNSPDVLTPRAGARVVLRYADGSAAGVAYRDASRGYETVVLGVPLEAIGPAGERDDFLGTVLADVEGPRVPVDGCGATGPEPSPEAVADEAPADATEPATDVGMGEVSGGAAEVVGARRDLRGAIRVTEGGCAAGGGLAGLGLGLVGLLVHRSSRRRARGAS
jgi:N-acetylmuramoyl-L-alanine amidase